MQTSSPVSQPCEAQEYLDFEFWLDTLSMSVADKEAGKKMSDAKDK